MVMVRGVVWGEGGEGKGGLKVGIGEGIGAVLMFFRGVVNGV